MTEHLTIYLNKNYSDQKNNINNKDMYTSEDNNVIIYIPYSISRKNNIIKEKIRISID